MLIIYGMLLLLIYCVIALDSKKSLHMLQQNLYNENNRYYSFKQNPNFDFFFNRLKDNAIKKYNAFYDDDFELESDLFSGFELVREVSVRVKKDGNSFIIIGSLWKNLEFELTNQNKDFYNFLFDNGLGEKNSLGFGFLNSGK